MQLLNRMSDYMELDNRYPVRGRELRKHRLYDVDRFFDWIIDTP